MCMGMDRGAQQALLQLGLNPPVDTPRQPRRVTNSSGVWAAYGNKTSHLESEGFMAMLFHVISQKTELHSAH